MINFGDHLFSDSKGPSKIGWRTAAIIRELEVRYHELIWFFFFLDKYLFGNWDKRRNMNYYEDFIWERKSFNLVLILVLKVFESNSCKVHLMFRFLFSSCLFYIFNANYVSFSCCFDALLFLFVNFGLQDWCFFKTLDYNLKELVEMFLSPSGVSTIINYCCCGSLIIAWLYILWCLIGL